MVYGIVGSVCVILGWVVYCQRMTIKELIAVNTKLCLDKGLHIVEIDPTGVQRVVKVQDRVSEIETTLKEMRETTLTRESPSAEEWTNDTDLPAMQDEVRPITRGQDAADAG